MEKFAKPTLHRCIWDIYLLVIIGILAACGDELQPQAASTGLMAYAEVQGLTGEAKLEHVTTPEGSTAMRYLIDETKDTLLLSLKRGDAQEVYLLPEASKAWVGLLSGEVDAAEHRLMSTKGTSALLESVQTVVTTAAQTTQSTTANTRALRPYCDKLGPFLGNACNTIKVLIKPSPFDKPVPVVAVTFPKDHYPHDTPMEWWYYTGHLQDEVGNDYGFELTFFKVATPPSLLAFNIMPAYWFIDHAIIGHAAITDLQTGAFHVAEMRGAPPFGEAKQGTYHVRLGSWHAKWQQRRWQGDRSVHDLAVVDDLFNLNVMLTPQKPIAAHGDPPGVQDPGPENVSYYISYTRMAADGQLKLCPTGEVSCKTLSVTGEAWFDHQWGSFGIGVPTKTAGWDWFSLQFEDNSELMAYLIRAPSNKALIYGGSYVAANGHVTDLHHEDVTITPTGKTWKSDTTDAIYPMSWHVQAPKVGVDVMAEAAQFNQEMDTRQSTGIVYWEGMIDAEGSHKGRGYAELTNYNLYPYGETDETTPLKATPAPGSCSFILFCDFRPAP